jgi:hypothetical protein
MQNLDVKTTEPFHFVYILSFCTAIIAFLGGFATIKTVLLPDKYAWKQSPTETSLA